MSGGTIKVKYQIDIMLVAERVLETKRGPLSLSVIEAEALALFVLWAEQFVPTNEMRKVTTNGYSK